MKHRLFNWMTVLSLLLCLLGASAWALSYPLPQGTSFAVRRGVRAGVHSGDGLLIIGVARIMIWTCDWDEISGPDLILYSFDNPPASLLGSRLSTPWWGFQRGSAWWSTIPRPPKQTAPGGGVQDDFLTIHYWVLVLATGLLPAWWLSVWIRRRPGDKKAVRCPACGYDVRASREECPECGEPIPAKPPPTTAP
jgi:hypothetical protein